MIPINSDILIPIEKHFRVSAGPGAGKTYWLINHIKNVLHNSIRLKKTRKIACITYTNIAVETILNRLGTGASQVEVSTIHSFLYKHIVKPYAKFLVDDYDLNVGEMDGHEEHVVSLKNVCYWIENHPNVNKLKHPYTVNQLTKLENNKTALKQWLSSLNYKFDENHNLSINSDRGKAYYLVEENGEKIRRYLNNNCLNTLSLNLLDYKKLYWQEGIVNHSDILFFSYQLIKKYPFILRVLQAKFPYFFVDEFQDTNPIQVEILKLIGEKETVVGIIGDEAQSIYGFQGAEPYQFQSFKLPNIMDYEIADNRRSTNQIIELLNYVRTDITQNKFRNVDGKKPTIIIGERIASLKKVKGIINNEDLYSLSRDNITSNSMKKEVDGVFLNDKLIEEFANKDKPSKSNNYRSKVIIACLKATEYARERDFKAAIRELERIFLSGDNKGQVRKEALRHLCLLLKRYDSFKNKSLFDFYSFVKSEIKKDISRLSSGAAKAFYETYSYQQLALCVKITEDLSKHKTIHKAKGDEFDNVLIILKSDNDLEVFLNPNLKYSEEQRIYYVAVSRAKERIFINIPSISEDKLLKLADMSNIISLVK